ncbi:hypothetical protein DPMN_175064 [Dreissena polymorpha]|uniref:Uncharacterized protein n=1 Tax=Dreissena polymorpha TaxID=45954 RepID=A0A9D4E7H5_DREPO|nr:hypothetical protein DPMN_175064 [Dreissena polymorpha]
MYSRHSRVSQSLKAFPDATVCTVVTQVSQRLKEFPDKAACTVVTLGYIRKLSVTRQRSHYNRSSKTEAGNVSLQSNLYTNQPWVMQKLT